MEEIKRIPVNLITQQFLITFEYETRIGKRKEQQRYIRHISQEEAKAEFKRWSKTVRTMTNVKILGIVEVDNSVERIAI